jgi:hypothetical protein
MPGYRAPEGTLPLLTGILQMMDYAHRDMCAIVRDLPVEALAWHPGGEMGSLSGIVRHAMYCEVYALRRAAGEEVRYEESVNRGLWEITDDAATLAACIAEGDAAMKRILPAMTVERMNAHYAAWGQTEETLAGELIAEAALHTAMHWGHMQMTRQQWTQQHPEFADTYKRW